MKKKELIKKIEISEPLILNSGKILTEYDIAYETYGKLNKKKSNGRYVCYIDSSRTYSAFKKS